MTAVILPPQPIAEGSNPLRLLPIAVNLLPEEVLAARAGSRAKRVTVGLLLLVLLGNGYWYYQASQDASSASDSLNSAQGQLAAAKSGQSAFGDLVTTQARIGSMGSAVESMTAGQIAWNRLLPAVRAATPAGVTVTGITGTATPSVVAAVPETTASTTPSPTPTPTAAPTSSVSTTAVGTLVIVGKGTSKDAIAAYVTALGRVKGVLAPFINNVSTDQTGGGFTYTIDTGVTVGAQDTRYATPAPTPTTVIK